MKILGVDTSSGLISLACNEGDKTTASLEEPLPQRSSEQLLPQARLLLEKAGWDVKEIDLVAVSTGPGSFTGLRVGLAFAKGLSLAGGPRILGFSTLVVWAECVRDSFKASGASKLAVLLDGRRGQVYRGLVSLDGKAWKEEMPQSLLNVDLAKEGLGENVALVTDVAEIEWAGPVLKRDHALAWGLNQLAWARLVSDPDATDNAAGLQPLYLRRTEAEILWDKRQGAANA